MRNYRHLEASLEDYHFLISLHGFLHLLSFSLRGLLHLHLFSLRGLLYLVHLAFVAFFILFIQPSWPSLSSLVQPSWLPSSSFLKSESTCTINLLRFYTGAGKEAMISRHSSIAHNYGKITITFTSFFFYDKTFTIQGFPVFMAPILFRP